MGGSSGQQPVTQQTTQTKDPWAPAQAYLQGTMNTANAYANTSVGYNPYTGNTTANPFNAYSLPVAQQISSLYGSEPLGSTQLASARGLMGDLVSNNGLSDPLQQMASTLSTQQNPFLQGAIDQQVGKVNSSFSGAGRYGSGMHDAAIGQAVAPILAQDYMQRQGMAADIYGQGLQRAGQAAQLIPTLDQARLSNANAMLGLGGMQQQYDQALLDQQLKLYNAQQAYPWEQLGRAQAIFGQVGGLGGSQITSSPGATQPSTMQRILGGGLAGAGLGSMFGPVGAGVGAVGGGLLGLM